MGLVSRVKALNPNAPVVRFIEHIFRACPIPPSPRIRAVPATKLFASAMIVGLAMTAAVMAALPLLIPLAPLGGLIDKDSVLPNRANPSWPSSSTGEPFRGGFYLVGNEKLVIRDCTIYTKSRVYAPSNLPMPEGGPAADIHLQEFSNLTMINVRFVPSVEISVSGNASLKMVNVTNWSTGWRSHTSEHEFGVLSLTYFGEVWAVGGGKYGGNGKIWIENSRIANVVRTREATGAKITVVNSWFAVSRPYTAVKINATINKTEFKWGEPITINFNLTNVGKSTLNFTKIDRFRVNVYEAKNYTNWPESVTLYEYSIPLPEFYPPSELLPSEMIIRKITLLSDGSTPFSILRGHNKEWVRTNEWWNTSLPPKKYSFSFGIDSRTFEAWFGGSQYGVTISEK